MAREESICFPETKVQIPPRERRAGVQENLEASAAAADAILGGGGGRGLAAKAKAFYGLIIRPTLASICHKKFNVLPKKYKNLIPCLFAVLANSSSISPLIAIKVSTS